MGSALRHCGIKAGATLLDRRKVEARGVCDGPKEVGVAGIGVGSRNCRMLACEQVGDRLRENETGLQVGVTVTVSVPNPPTGVHSELREVRKAKLSAGSRGSAAGQGTKLFEADGTGPFGLKICIQKVLMGEFIVRVVVDVLRHITIKDLKSAGIGRISAAAWNFARVWNTAEFVVLNPEVRFENFGRGSESQHGCIAWRQAPAL